MILSGSLAAVWKNRLPVQLVVDFSQAPLAARRPLLGDAARLVGDMKAYFASLMLEKAALDAKLEAVTTAMNALGGAAPRAKPSRATRRTLISGMPGKLIAMATGARITVGR